MARLVDGVETVQLAVLGACRDDVLHVLCPPRYEVEVASRVADVLESASRTSPCLVLVDLGGARARESEGLRRLLARDEPVPLLVVQDEYRADDCARVLECPPADYLSRPIDEGVLRARASNLVWPRIDPSGVLRFGGLGIDLARRRASIGGSDRCLSPKELELLLLLARARGECVDRAVLLGSIWDLTGEPSSPLLEVLVSRLRRRLGTLGPRIERVGREGYRLTPSLDRVGDEAA